MVFHEKILQRGEGKEREEISFQEREAPINLLAGLIWCASGGCQIWWGFGLIMCASAKAKFGGEGFSLRYVCRGICVSWLGRWQILL